MSFDSFTRTRDKSEITSTNVLPKGNSIVDIEKWPYQDDGRISFDGLNQEVIRLGKMRKHGWSMTWKNKFCVLSVREGALFLSFYNSVKDSMDSQSKNGGIHIPRETKVVHLSVEEASNLNAPYTHYCFSINVSSKKLTFCTETITCMWNWIWILESCLVAKCLDSTTNLSNNNEKVKFISLISRMKDERIMKASFVLTDRMWETLWQTDNWQVFTAKFSNFSFKLKPGLRKKTSIFSCRPNIVEENEHNLLEIWSKLKFSGQFMKDVGEIKSFLVSFYGEGCLKVGWLFKRGRFIKSWKRRFCVLTNTVLEYYKEKMDTAPQGFILIADIETINTGLTANNKEEFHLITKDRVWNFAAADENNREDWMSSIEHLKFDDINYSSLCSYQHRTSSVWRSKCEENMIHFRSESS